MREIGQQIAVIINGSPAVPVFSRQVGGNGQVVLLAGLSGVPVGLACGAELEGTNGTLDQLG